MKRRGKQTAQEAYQYALDMMPSSHCQCPMDENSYGDAGFHHFIARVDFCWSHPVGPRGIERLVTLTDSKGETYRLCGCGAKNPQDAECTYAGMHMVAGRCPPYWKKVLANKAAEEEPTRQKRPWNVA